MALKPTTITTGNVRLSYVHLTRPFAREGQEPRYSVTILLPKSDVATKQRIDAAIEAAIQEGVSKVWNGVRPPQIKTPIYDGDGVRPNGEQFGPECKGHWVFTASSRDPVDIVDLNLNQIINPTEIYSGMFAKVCVNFFAFNRNGNRGIGAGLGPVQKVADGEPLGGRAPTAEEAFGAAQVTQPTSPAYPGYSPTPTGQPPAYPGYPPAPAEQPPVYPSYPTPTYPPQAYPRQPAAPVQIDPITGKPLQGGIMGL
ncbi:DUF2815 family protein [Thermicanus aegyptius]|uniref:DUF2815 family protein n=1 Tax=Thermicanus aegyptius TaxID=94009 RepID=UPI00040A67C4|nr:DUF2815 family protein [Thermicanus aegyptius]